MANENLKPARFVQPPKERAFKVMSNQDIDEYMSKLAQTNGEGLGDIEKEVERALRDVAQQKRTFVEQANQLRSQLSQLERNSNQLTGQLDALGFVLQKAEDERRWKEMQEKKMEAEAKKDT